MRRNHGWTVNISCLAFLWTSFLGIQLSASGLRQSHPRGDIEEWPILSCRFLGVSVSPPVLGQTLLAIYKRKGKEGILLRNYRVDNLWNLKPGEERMSGYFDGTPEWFDDGVFSFTDDGAALLYIDKKHGLLQFSLENGAVRKLQ